MQLRYKHFLFARDNTHLVRGFNRAITMQGAFIRRTYAKYFEEGFPTTHKFSETCYEWRMTFRSVSLNFILLGGSDLTKQS